MPADARNIKRQASFKKVTEILSKNNSVLGKVTLGAFVLLGLLALASPAALPAEIAALGIGAVGIFLDKVTDEKLSEEDIVQGVQNIINENGLLQKSDFLDYMAPFYPKLIEISEKLDSFSTNLDLQEAIFKVLPTFEDLSKKIDSIATKDDLARAVEQLKDTKSFQTKEERLKEAWNKLVSIPLKIVPNPSIFKQGSKNFKFSPNPNFIGRNSELISLATLFKGESPEEVGKCVAVTGMGGVGKTQLVVEFVQRYGQYFAGGVYWIDFSQPELISNQIADCSKISQEQTVEVRLQQVLADWKDEFPRLLIFDNCESLELLRKWLPSTGGRRVIITSRHKNLGKEMGVTPLPLEPLDRDSSIALLNHYLEDIKNDNTSLDIIAEELGDLPLALHLAGSYLQKYRFEVNPEKYLADLQQVKPLQHRSMKSGKFSPTNHDLNVERTFLISYQKLSENPEDEIAIKIIFRAACFAPGAWIPRGVLQASLGKEVANEQFADGLGRLLSLGLIEENETGDVWIHRLVCSFVRNLDKNDNTLNDVENTVIKAANIINNQGFPARMQPLLRHLQLLTDQALLRKDENAATLANDLGYFFQLTGQYEAARPYYEQALAIRRKVLGEEHPDTATSLNNLGSLLQAMGQYEAARPYYEQALAIRRKSVGEEHPDTANSLNNLGYLLKAMGQYEAARPNYEQALAICRKVLGEENTYTATCLNNLGALLQAMGQYEAAQPYFEQTLAICRKVLGEEHPDTAGSLNNLGGLFDSMGKYVAARPYYEQALAIRRKVLGEEHPDTATSLNNLGYLLKAMGQYEAARPYYEQALAIRRKVLGEEHPDTASSLNSLGSLLQAMGQYEAAQPYFEQTLAIRRKVLGEEHPDTASSLNNLGSLLQDMGKYEAARPYYEQALAISRKVLGEEHPDTATSLNNLGGLLYSMGQYEAAIPYYEQALAILQKTLCEDHPSTKIVQGNLDYLLMEIEGLPENKDKTT